MNMQAIFDAFPLLESRDLIMKRIEPGHLDEVYSIYSNDNVFEYCGIIPKHNKETVKSMIGYFLAESHWGQGIATQAVQALVKFLFEAAHVNRIQAEVLPPNESSKKVLLKNGFRQEGILRQAHLWSGKGVVDLEIYGILREEYVSSSSN
ncbi:GNAT family protein [Paenibacillus woosongensis]|uniref:GNAT family protein n=1 Tax=Paenibacillus woosongensis TaxID=307580 RepID=A0AA95IAR2_9BACL|nr:GNAT family protein [Paenibacillus woosongensis]WHX50479.1 GNAT family protein [Paenibacillus woosongensis]